jgi:hypothetical protein
MFRSATSCLLLSLRKGFDTYTMRVSMHEAAHRLAPRGLVEVGLTHFRSWWHQLGSAC